MKVIVCFALKFSSSRLLVNECCCELLLYLAKDTLRISLVSLRRYSVLVLLSITLYGNPTCLVSLVCYLLHTGIFFTVIGWFCKTRFAG